MTPNQLNDNARGNANYNSVCTALSQGRLDDAIAITENDVSKVMSGVPNSNAANIAQGNANLAQMFSAGGEGLYDALSVAGLAQASQYLGDDDLDDALKATEAAASEGCKVIDGFGDPNTQQALHALGQSLGLVLAGVMAMKSAQGLKGVGPDMVPRSVAHLVQPAPGSTAISPSAKPDAPIGGANAWYAQVHAQAVAIAATVNHTPTHT